MRGQGYGGRNCCGVGKKFWEARDRIGYVAGGGWVGKEEEGGGSVCGGGREGGSWHGEEP